MYERNTNISPLSRRKVGDHFGVQVIASSFPFPQLLTFELLCKINYVNIEEKIHQLITFFRLRSTILSNLVMIRNKSTLDRARMRTLDTDTWLGVRHRMGHPIEFKK
jgi:hypothetical protein